VTVRGCVLKDVLRGGGWSWKEQRVISIYQHLEFVSKRDAPPSSPLPPVLFSSSSSSFQGKKKKK
jgi:hypothetical protein